MDMLKRLEKRLGEAMEGVFGKGPQRRLQAQTLAGAVAQAAKEGAVATLETTLYPNRYLIKLNPGDAKEVLPVLPTLRSELRSFVESMVEKAGGALPGPVVVKGEVDEGVEPGECKVDAYLQEGQPESHLAVEQGPDQGRMFRLQTPLVDIGRGEDCAVELSDGRVSRRHCEIRFHESRFWLSDLGSTNGTVLNGRAIERETLEDGDRVELGMTVLEFHIT